MTSTDEIAGRMQELFEAKEAARERSLQLARQVIRECSVSIRSVHRDEMDQAKDHLKQARAALLEAEGLLKCHKDIWYAGFLEDSQQEYVEAVVVLSLIETGRLPTPEEVGAEPASYLCGLGDACGELRRHILDLIRQGRPGDGEFFLQSMEDIYHLLMLFDYPEAIIRGVRRKADLARSMLERTRGDLTNAMGRRALEVRLQQLEDKLKGPDSLV